jgi:amino acid transporter
LSTNGPRLSPRIGLFGLIGVTFAVIAPVSSVFLTYGTGFQLAGTGIVAGYVVGALLNLAIMGCYGEVGSQYPEAGGDYALAARALGRRTGSVYAVLLLVKGMVVPALLSLSTAAYLHTLAPGLAATPTAVGLLLLALLLSALDLRTSSLLVTLMVGVELTVFLLFIGVGVTHLQQPLAVLWHPVVNTPGGLARVPSGAWLGAATAALYGLNGPQATLYYSEETRARPDQFGRTILGSAVATVLIELSAVVVATLALPSLSPHAVGLPLARVMEAGLRPTTRRMILGGITLALFDTELATTMSYARIFYAIARDRQWPGPLNRACLSLSRRGVPWGALVTLGSLNLAVTMASAVPILVTLSGTILIVVYLGIALSSLLTRLTRRPPWAMPAWPLPPLVALVGLGMVLAQVRVNEIRLTALIVGLGVLWALLAPGLQDDG